MIPTFLAFQAAGRALTAHQASLNVTGNNISNANTDGYTRQRVDLASIAGNSAIQKYAAAPPISYGVDIQGINQVRDGFLDARFRNENSNNQYYDSVLTKMSDLENVFDEIDTDGLQTQLTDFIKQLQTFSDYPTDQDVALVVKTSAQKLTQIMNTYGQRLTEVKDQAVYDLSTAVVDRGFNSLVENIAFLNQQIKTQQTYGNSPNELYDKRNLLIDELSGLANIKVTTTSETISENITVENLAISIYDEITGARIPLVDNGLYNTLYVDTKGDSLSINLMRNFGQGPSGDITENFTSGAIKGYVDIINGVGTYANSGENAFNGITYYQKSMDTFASTFAQVFNNLNGTDDAGNPKLLFTASGGKATITASNIAISEEWLFDSSYITTTTSTSTGSGDNDNILRMIQSLESKVSFYADNGQRAFHGSFGEYIIGISGNLASDISLFTNFSETSGNILQTLSDSRESISGVVLDEEAINLMAFQKSYNAAARYMTALDEALNTVLGMGLVGR